MRYKLVKIGKISWKIILKVHLTGDINLLFNIQVHYLHCQRQRSRNWTEVTNSENAPICSLFKRKLGEWSPTVKENLMRFLKTNFSYLFWHKLSNWSNSSKHFRAMQYSYHLLYLQLAILFSCLTSYIKSNYYQFLKHVDSTTTTATASDKNNSQLDRQIPLCHDSCYFLALTLAQITSLARWGGLGLELSFVHVKCIKLSPISAAKLYTTHFSCLNNDIPGESNHSA